MNDMTIAQIPVLYTAIAESISCLLISLMGKRRRTGMAFFLVSVCFFLIEGVFWILVPAGNPFFWIARMLLAFFFMFSYLWLTLDENKKDTLYYAVTAFSTAELIASAAWQFFVFYFYEYRHIYRLQAALFLGLFYTFFFGLFWLLFSRCFDRKKRLGILPKEMLILTVAEVLIFFLSNITFTSFVTPFTFRDAGALLSGRTIVDLSGFILVYAINMQRAELKARAEAASFEELLRNQYLQYEMAKESVDLVNYKYHDLKHYIQILRKENDTDARNEFLDEMEESIRMYEAQNKTGNKVVDTILTSKNMICEKEGIEFTSVVDGTALNFLHSADICSLLGNALDNAIEYEKKVKDPEKRLIHTAIFSQNQFLIMRFENYFEGELEVQEGLPVTTKARKEYHGFGLRSIRYVAEKYGGNTDYEVKNNWFVLKILIPVPAQTV